ncbi:MAG: polysaccharide deacetylase family protein [Anaerolineaceae bacterium]|nr:polysaccharide deacetylase family protein [Anaerolineaceae bacterium]
MQPFVISLRPRLAVSLVVCLLALNALARAQDGTMRRIRVPILMYHYVSPLPRDADTLRIGLTVRPEVFREQLTWLRDAGYSSISPGQLFRALDHGEQLPPKPLILTFDDGHVDHFSVVMPLLLEAGFSGTFFIISERVDARDPLHLDREQLVAMAAQGMSIESHSRSHRDLSGLERDLLVYELLGSRESLEAWTGVEPTAIAWPFGKHDALARQVAREAGYRMALSTRAGVLHDSTGLFDLARLRVNRDLTLRNFEALLRADWLEERGAA